MLLFGADAIKEICIFWQLAKPGLDWTGSDWTGPDRIGSQNSDWINNNVPAQSRHIKSLGHQLRLLTTFARVLQEKVRTRASFNKILTNYTSEKSLVNVVYDKKFCLSNFKCQDQSW